MVMMRVLQSISKIRHGRLAVVMLFASLVVRAMIPNGYMPGNLLAGEFMVLCPQGLPLPAAQALHHDHGAKNHGAENELSFDADRACPIGSALLAVAPPPAVTFPETLAAGRYVPQDPVVLPPQTLRILSYESRAPPGSDVITS